MEIATGGTTRDRENDKAIKEKQREKVETGNDDSHDDPQCRCMLLDVSTASYCYILLPSR